jgi:hypothetical protein
MTQREQLVLQTGPRHASVLIARGPRTRMLTKTQSTILERSEQQDRAAGVLKLQNDDVNRAAEFLFDTPQHVVCQRVPDAPEELPLRPLERMASAAAKSVSAAAIAQAGLLSPADQEWKDQGAGWPSATASASASASASTPASASASTPASRASASSSSSSSGMPVPTSPTRRRVTYRVLDVSEDCAHVVLQPVLDRNRMAIDTSKDVPRLTWNVYAVLQHANILTDAETDGVERDRIGNVVRAAWSSLFSNPYTPGICPRKFPRVLVTFFFRILLISRDTRVGIAIINRQQ